MRTKQDTREDEAVGFGGGVRVIDQRQGNLPRSLALDARSQKKDRTAPAGFDPYNTSGSFDRKKNWTRVGKR